MDLNMSCKAKSPRRKLVSIDFKKFKIKGSPSKNFQWDEFEPFPDRQAEVN